MIDREGSVAGQGGVGEVLIGTQRDVDADDVVGGLVGDDPIQRGGDARGLRCPGIGRTAVSAKNNQLNARRDTLPVGSVAAEGEGITAEDSRHAGAVTIGVNRCGVAGEKILENQIFPRKGGMIRIGPGVDHHHRLPGPGNLRKVDGGLILMNQHRIKVPGSSAVHPTGFQSLEQRAGGGKAGLDFGQRLLFNHGVLDPNRLPDQ